MAFSIDKLIEHFDAGLRTIHNLNLINSVSSLPQQQDDNLNHREKKHSASLMRINHVGEICAQALYRGQQINAKQNSIKDFLSQAEKEEQIHLFWCYQRLKQLNSHTSYLNPVWYTGAFTFGYIASKISDNISLAFVKETEIQVEQHLKSHLDKISSSDYISKQIINQMINDEVKHAKHAENLGASELPKPIKYIMRNIAKVMTSIAYYI